MVTGTNIRGILVEVSHMIVQPVVARGTLTKWRLESLGFFSNLYKLGSEA